MGVVLVTPQEERALLVCCPLCRAGVGRPCMNMASTDTRFGRLTVKHPHRERITKGAGGS